MVKGTSSSCQTERNVRPTTASMTPHQSHYRYAETGPACSVFLPVLSAKQSGNMSNFKSRYSTEDKRSPKTQNSLWVLRTSKTGEKRQNSVTKHQKIYVVGLHPVQACGASANEQEKVPTLLQQISRLHHALLWLTTSIKQGKIVYGYIHGLKYRKNVDQISLKTSFDFRGTRRNGMSHAS